MNTSTYAKLIKPPQFKPNESVTFRLEFSRDLSCSNATLRIYGYTLDVDKGGSYSGLTMTKYIGTFIAGVGVEEFVIPPNTLGEIPPDDSIMYWSSGTMKAVVEIGDFKSNEIIVDMIMDLPSDTYIEPDNETLISTGSTYKLNIVHNPRATFGSYDSNEVNSYRVLLYDQDYNLINDSGVKYDWANGIYANHFYNLTNLKDNTNYYVKVKMTLVGGYTIDTNLRKLEVKYDDIPVYSEYVSLENDIAHGRVNVLINPNINYDKAIISRTVRDANDYLEIRVVNKGESNTNPIKIYDYYALPKTTYTYRVVLFNQDDIVATYYNDITHEFDGVCIADAFAGYNALAYNKKYPINKNDKSSIVEPIDTQYPISINSNLDYDSGNITATFAYIDKCEPDFANNAEYSKTIRHWLNNGQAKVLKFHNGECWIVATSGVSDDEPNGNDVISTSFNWTEIGNVRDNTEYARLGLILNE